MDIAALDRVCEEHGPFDIVIDDGSHQVKHVLTTFHHLYPRMPENGIYVVEDTQTAFWPETGGHPQGADTIFQLAFDMSVAMHDLEVKGRTVPAPPHLYGAITASIEILRHLIFFERGDNTFPSNASMRAEHAEVARIYDVLASEAVREPSAGNYLTRMDVATWTGAVEHGVAAAREALAAYPDRGDVLLAAYRMMERAQRGPECLEIARRLDTLFPADPSIQALLRKQVELGAKA